MGHAVLIGLNGRRDHQRFTHGLQLDFLDLHSRPLGFVRSQCQLFCPLGVAPLLFLRMLGVFAALGRMLIFRPSFGAGNHRESQRR